jgi:outer membrane protein assembly factor BamB
MSAVAGLVALVLVFASAIPTPVGAQLSAIDKDRIAAATVLIVARVDVVADGVVQREFDRQPLGSGAIVSDNGIILTNSHVVNDEILHLQEWVANQEIANDLDLEIAPRFVIYVVDGRGDDPDPRFSTTYNPDWDHPELDLAVLAISGDEDGRNLARPVTSDREAIPLAPPGVIDDETGVWLFGYPEFGDEASTAGWASRSIDAVPSDIRSLEFVPGSSEVSAIVLSAGVARGSSGGPVVNERGQLVGIIRASRGGDAAVAIPVDRARTILEAADWVEPSPPATAPPETPAILATATANPTATTAPPPPTATATSPSATAAPREVPMFRANPSRTGVMAGPGPQTDPRVLWRFPTDAPVVSSPVVASGVVYFGSRDGNIYAVDAATGDERWHVPTGQDVTGSPAVVDGLVYIGSRDSHLYALDARTGSERFRFKTGNAVYSSPVVVAGFVYFGSLDGNVYAVEATSGEERWRFSTDDEASSSPAVVDRMVFIGSDVNAPGQDQGGAIFALSATSGQQRWRVDVGRDVFSSPAVIGATMYVGSRDGNVYALDVGTGDERWRFVTGNAVWSSPAVTGGVVYIGSSDGNLYALDAATGDERWRFRIGDDVFASPAVVGDLVYIGGVDGYVYALERETGQERWRIRIGSPVNSSPTVAGGVLYVGSDDGYLYAIGKGSG